MAAKRTSELVPLCHPIAITHVSVELDVVGIEEAEGKSEMEGEVKRGNRESTMPSQGTEHGGAYSLHTPNFEPQLLEKCEEVRREGFGKVDITATVSCDGKTGVEMEALTAASIAALTVYDMCKAVDKGMRIEGLRVVMKDGGKSGLWVEGVKEEHEI